MKKGKRFISPPPSSDYVKTSESKVMHWMNYLIRLARGINKPLLEIDTESNLEISVNQSGNEIFIHLINMNIDRRIPRCMDYPNIPVD